MSEQAPSPYKACIHPHAAASVGQAVFGDRLLWTRSYSCPHCTQIEDDGAVMPTKEARAILLAANGAWEVIVDPGAPAATMQVIAAALDLSPEEARDYARNLPYAYVGTKTEAEWLQAQMLKAGIRSRVERTRLPS